jgi:hypothetical protein
MPPTLALSLLLAGTSGGAWWLWRRQVAFKREVFIREAVLPRGLYDKLRQRRPELSLKDCQLVGNGLRQFFLAYLKSGRSYVSMPSQVVDELWHEFILHTRHYEAFCRQAFGGFLHHTPAVVLQRRGARANAGLRRCWWYACLEEHLNPRRPTRLPLLFALDTKLGIAGGFHYVVDCTGLKREGADGSTVVYCGGDFDSPAFDGGTEGFGDGGSWGGGSDGHGGHGSSDGGSSDGGGDGGSSCGGGGCGGD